MVSMLMEEQLPHEIIFGVLVLVFADSDCVVDFDGVRKIELVICCPNFILLIKGSTI